MRVLVLIAALVCAACVPKHAPAPLKAPKCDSRCKQPNWPDDPSVRLRIAH